MPASSVRKLPQGVLHRYEAMLEKEETQAAAKQMIRNYEQARTHPDEADEKQAEAFALRVLSQCG
ncbi:MAG: flavodoxin family protein [Merdibacter sp.]